jgi:CheY-like chemotaxis protein/HPt (histidine-containing phosphotransfer) domain-containing protein
VAAYAAETQATVLLLPDLASLQDRLLEPPSAGPAVLVLGPEQALLSLALPPELGLVRLSQLSAPQDVADELTVTGFPLIFNDLVRALALASRMLTPSPALQNRVPGAVQVPDAPTVDQAAQQQQLLLLADDNEVNRTVIQEQLRLLGYASETAEDGLVALQMWRSGRYALLLTDCHMPHMDGFALTEAIRQAEPAGTRLPIVAITANAMQGEAKRCLDRGMDDYLAKPLRMLELAPMLHKWLPLSSPNTAALLSMAVPNALPAAQAAVWDMDMLGQMVGDDAPMQRRLLDMFLRNAETQIAAICLSTAVSRMQDAADQAHSLKSAARMVGAMAFGALCEEIECAGLAADAALCVALAQDLDAQLEQVQAAIQAHGVATKV